MIHSVFIRRLKFAHLFFLHRDYAMEGVKKVECSIKDFILLSDTIKRVKRFL